MSMVRPTIMQNSGRLLPKKMNGSAGFDMYVQDDISRFLPFLKPGFDYLDEHIRFTEFWSPCTMP